MDPPRPPAAEDPGRGGLPPPLLTMLGFAFLTFNSAMAVYRSQGDPQSVALVTFSYVDLVLLFFCLRSYEREPAGYGSRRKWRVKAAVWVLTTLLTLAFSYKVAEVMPPVVAVLVWAMAAATVVGGFYAFFVHESKPSTTSEPQNTADSAV
ncbi:uncharacterized protein LOC120692068 [Panicum virgatum]|uniref:Uncharacterized protein n=1 Tax=Panicum virgatum TaxID=38727 RepID=A0A8T0XCE9_PANVG|nr:uncharacterized protein LOC120692068 [Panicum virgatum]KAG2657085.1 hypothetical protein PVAP13_1KG194900 [Panicum virgatum]